MIETYEVRATIVSPTLIRVDVRGIQLYLTISEHDKVKIDRQLAEEAKSLLSTLLFKLNY